MYVYVLVQIIRSMLYGAVTGIYRKLLHAEIGINLFHVSKQDEDGDLVHQKSESHISAGDFSHLGSNRPESPKKRKANKLAGDKIAIFPRIYIDEQGVLHKNEKPQKLIVN